MKWFKHDANASIDAKIEKLMLKYGLEGYGLYFFCLELIARNVEKHNLTFELEHDSELISKRVNLHPSRVQEMMVFMVNLGLFENDRGVITCLKLAKRTDEYTQKLLSKASFVPTISRQSPDALGIKSELKEENRIEEIYIPKKTKKFEPPELKDISDFIEQKKYRVNAETFFNYYSSIDWMIGKHKMKSWQMALAYWNSKNKEEEKETQIRDWI